MDAKFFGQTKDRICLLSLPLRAFETGGEGLRSTESPEMMIEDML